MERKRSINALEASAKAERVNVMLSSIAAAFNDIGASVSESISTLTRNLEEVHDRLQDARRIERLNEIVRKNREAYRQAMMRKSVMG